MTTLTTKRLKIYPMTCEQMKQAVSAECDPELRCAYSQMLELSVQFPESCEWYAMWRVERLDGTAVGDFCFKGENGGFPEVGYGIYDEYQGNGYATEALTALVEWAFSHEDVKAVEAEAAADNIPSQKVLEKCGFVKNGVIGDEGERFTRKRS